jgi:hypothetical protein
MAGRVFVSCGQRGDERRVALRIQDLLKKTFALDSYLAFRIQSLDDVMIITEELRKSDYYLFIDFFRHADHADDFSCSLFTHQELALAHHLGFRDIIALRDARVPQEGFIRYVLSNPSTFSDEEELFRKLSALVKDRGWSSKFSRNLVVSNLHISQPDPHRYGDHTGTFNMRTWSVDIENRRPDVAATRTICILDIIEDRVGAQASPDRSFLKWSGFLQRYESTLLPEDFGTVNLCSVREQQSGLFLLSQMDFSPRQPVVRDDGNYMFQLKVFSEGFPLLKFNVRFRLARRESSACSWDDSEGELIR